MADQDVNVSIRGQVGELVTAMRQAQESVAAMAAGAQTSLASAGAAFEKFNLIAVGMTAVLAGGRMFSDAIEEAKRLTRESNLLARQLGIGATEASYLAMGIDDVGGTIDDLVTASRGLTRQLKSNEESITNLGVKTRDSNGNLRNLNDIMFDAVKAVNEYTSGTDRNLAAQAAFGRGVTGTSAILKTSEEKMAASRVQAEALGLVVGRQSVEAYEAYRVAMDDAGDTVQALGKAVGSELMPVLAEMASWFASIGPAAVIVIKGAFGGLVSTVWVVITAVKVLWQLLVDLAKSIYDVFAGISGVIDGFIHGLVTGDFSGVSAALKQTWAALGSNYSTMVDGMVEDTKAGAEKIWRLFANEDEAGAGPKGKSYNSGKDKAEALAALNARTKFEEAMGKAKLDAARKSIAESERLLNDEVALEEDALDHKKTILLGELDSKRIQLAAMAEAGEISHGQELEGLRQLEDAKYTIETMGLAKRAANANLTSIERQKASEKLEVLAQQHANMLTTISGKELVEISALEKDAAEFKKVLLRDGLEAQRAALSAQADAGEISFEQELNGLRQLEDAKLAIESAGLADRAANENLSALERQQARDRDLLLHQQHANAITAIETRQRLATTAKWKELTGSIQSGMQQTIASFLKGTLSIKGLLQGMVSAVLDAITGMVAKIIAQWIAMKIQQLIISKTSGASEVAVNASIAATAAMASVAAIPVYGWAMAPGVGASTYATAMAYEATAAGGYDIPANVNPITQLHAKEMVLPAHLAETVRGMAGKGGASAPSAGSDGGTVNLHINTLDSTSFSTYLRNGGARQITEALARRNR